MGDDTLQPEVLFRELVGRQVPGKDGIDIKWIVQVLIQVGDIFDLDYVDAVGNDVVGAMDC